MTRPHVILQPKRARPFYGRHPWVFAGAIAAIEGAPADGAEVDLVASGGSFIARGLFNSQSKIRVRLYSWSPADALDEAFFRRRLEAALRLRYGLLGLDNPSGACRLVFSESDDLSGLIVDRYANWLVVQFTALAMALRREMIADLLVDLVKPQGIYLRTERGVGKLEGLVLHDGPLRGPAPLTPIEIEEDGLFFKVDLGEGQKTGFYLDQRDNRRIFECFAAGRSVLDAFCYTGGFGIYAARAGASQVLGVDASESAIQLARANTARNNLSKIRFEASEVFDFLDERVKAQEKFGVVILDPPKFARKKGAVEEALRGYRRLFTLALRLLEPDGILFASCCSGLVQLEDLLELLSQVAVTENRDLQILETRGASPDHPVNVACLESRYLKCLIGRIV